MKKVLRFVHKNFVSNKRRDNLSNRLHPYLKNSKTVLDIGASDGKLSYNLSKKLNNTNFQGIDVFPQPKTYIPIKKYDGKSIPYKDNTFDCVMLIDVLHHANDQQQVLKEAKRVSKKYILIKDHFFRNKIGLINLYITDFLGNFAYNIDLKYKFWNLSTWNKEIKNAKLKKRKLQKFTYKNQNLSKHVIFLLEK